MSPDLMEEEQQSTRSLVSEELKLEHTVSTPVTLIKNMDLERGGSVYNVELAQAQEMVPAPNALIYALILLPTGLVCSPAMIAELH
uniref:Uncharacterized protein n=1 Tax=Leersia perrieri TaxID=77586 RepID=A0A0D9X799_9ORYZ